ncbi:hypothetical protein ACM66B_003910 [Microbotryomycetes sp. NB124-2]
MSRVYEHRPLVPPPVPLPAVAQSPASSSSLFDTRGGGPPPPPPSAGGGTTLPPIMSSGGGGVQQNGIGPGPMSGMHSTPGSVLQPSVLHSSAVAAAAAAAAGAAPDGGPPPPPPSGARLALAPQQQHPHTARLNDLLEFVKAEFDQVAQDATSLRQQREEYEQIISHHSNELNAMRAMSYDLERKHHEDKRALQEENSRLQDEVVRLRQQVDSTTTSNRLTPAPPTGTPGTSSSSQHPRPTLPPLGSATAPRPTSSSQQTLPPVGHGLPNLYGNDNGSNREADVKRGRSDDDERPTAASKAANAGSRPSSTGPGTRPSPLPTNGALPSLSTPARDRATTPATSSTTANAAAATPAPTDEKMGEAFDPETVTRDLKKEGSDWMTMFNPNVKRVLDVGLVHTLVHESVVCCVRFSPDGKTLATGCNRFTTLYDTKTGAKITTLVDESPGVRQDNYIRSACFSPDGKLLATGSEDRIIRIWNLSQKRMAKVFQGHKSEIYSLAFSPDGKRLMSGSGDRTAKVWDMDSGSCIFSLGIEDVTVAENGPIDAGVTSVVMSPDGTLLAAGSLDTFVRIWDAKTGQLLDKLKGHKDSVYSVAFSPDGKFLVSGSLDKTLKMWDVAAFQKELIEKPGVGVGEGNRTPCLTTLQGHKDYVLSVDISPDGAWIVSGSKDRGVQFWDPRTAKAQFMLQGHKNSVISVAVSAQGGLVATGSGDWSARIWHYERIA